MRRAGHGLEPAALLLQSHIQHGVQSSARSSETTNLASHPLFDLREASSSRNAFFNLVRGLRLLDAADLEALGDLCVIYRVAISPEMRSKSKVRPPTASSDGGESRRWREGTPRTHERLDVLPVGQLRKPRVRLVALHVHQPGLRDTNISIGMVQLVEFPDLVEEDAVCVRFFHLPPARQSSSRASMRGLSGSE